MMKPLTQLVMSRHLPQTKEELDMKKTLKLFVSVLSICSLVSCKKKQENNDAPKQEEPRYNVVDDKFIMENGVSEYVVLLSKTP